VKVTAGPVKVMAALKVTYGLIACSPGSAPGPVLRNECGRTYLRYYDIPTVFQMQSVPVINHARHLAHTRIDP